jgi:DNA mismatch endonuclease (patch repair protein)
MRAIRKFHTKPEIRVRQRLHALGFRFRLHRRDLPGTPDIVLPRHKVAIQVHGCFWHQHPGCRHAIRPRTNQDYWLPKLARNVARDVATKLELEALGWRVLVIWECELGEDARLDAAICNFI